ncbi:MAG: DUF4097 family beta strand repeat protein [Gammaproteobacteria bacterium]|nr:DUF4097 family beta strand repeat protein [Gammaproteobacteria bacterium]
MTSSIRTAASLGAALIVTAFVSAEAQQATGSFDRRLTLDGPVELEVVTGSGSVEVRRGRSGEARVAGRISVHRSWGRGADEAEEIVSRIEADPPIELVDGRLRVGRIEDSEARRNVSISYEIEIPADTPVGSRTGSGSQSISGVAAPVDASTGSGSIALADIGGPATASTGSGSINASGIGGAFTGRTGSGGVRLVQSAPGDVHIETGSGSSRVSGVQGAVRVRAGSGSIEVQGEPTGPWTLESGSGSITLRLPSDVGFDIDAASGSGGIQLEHPVEGTIRRGRVDGTVRGGGPLLDLRTGSGSVNVL